MPTFSAFEDRSYNALLKRMRTYEVEVNVALRNSLDQIRVDMAKIYDKYAVDGKLSLADMTRYNRLATMEKSVTASMSEATRKNVRTFNRLRPEMYQESFFRYAWAIDQDAGVNIAWGVLNRDVVLENLASEFDRISRATYGPEARATVRRAMNQGLAQGKSYTAMMRDIKGAFNITSGRAMRIVRTEGQTAMNAGQDDVYTRAQAKGIEGDRIWDSTLDARTRPTTPKQKANHRIMDGQVKAQPDDSFASGFFILSDGTRAPFPAWQGIKAANQRVNCRCRERFQIKEYPPQVRRSREQGVIPYQTYPEWEKNLNSRGRSVPKVAPIKSDTISFTSVGEASDWFKQTLGVERASLNGMDLRVLADYANGASAILKEFPEIKKHINIIQTTKASTKYASFSQTVKEGQAPIARLNVSKTLGGDYDTLVKNINADIQKKFHFASMTPAHISTHELAHALDSVYTSRAVGLNLGSVMSNSQRRLYVSTWNNRSVSRDITNRAFTKMGLSTSPQSAEEARAAYSAVQGLGSYALTNKQELFAEAMSDALMSKNPLPFSKAVLSSAKDMQRELIK